ncbi:uncharacterized protein LOC116778462 [Danaus plexippus]|uniref:uncharacterized protein LOC116778462 n=1 Tax=Danaus plexippus TaxID=13037 RepID=UPI002AB231CF|nr:uncharacterized protein LOC116778462 [Danaus plexippus]
MDADGSRANSTLGSVVSDGSTKYAHSSPILQANRIQSFNDIGSNSMGKMDAPTSRPCAIIGPDRVLPSNAGDIYLKKTVAPWPCPENVYRHTTDYQSKLPEYQPNRNISPRQTFQENMQRIMVPPTYSSIKIPEESSSKNTKLNMPHEAKYCDVPYNNSVNNELKSVRNPDIPITNMNPAFGRSVPPYGWPPGVNVRPLRPYGAPDFYQYSEYPSCAGTRPMVRQHQALNGESTQMYPDHLYQESNISFKPYPLAKERHPQVRYDYINNYPNSFHPSNPFPPHRYDLQKSIHGHPYPVYPQIPVKYLDRRIHEPIPDSYQRSSNTPNFMAYRNQPVAPPYGPLSGNCIQNKPYALDGSSKPNNKIHFEPNSKVYVDLEPKHNKGYPIPDNIYLNEMNHHQSLRGDILLQPNSTLSMHTVPQHAIYRKDNTYPKNFEYNIQYRNVDQPMNNSLPRFPLQYSPNTLAISPSDSNTSNDTALTLGAPQEDCGYVSQSSTTSVRSLDSYNIQATNDTLRRHNYNNYGIQRNNGKEMISKRKSSTSDKKNINVRQFLQMWNEGDDDISETNKETGTSNDSTKNDEEQLYVLGLVNVPSDEIGKYEHIQKISKLPENIKGYNSLELLNQYEELLEPSNTDKFTSKPIMTRQCNLPLRNTINKEHITVPRPMSPLDVEAKISQSVIHKEVGCNFEIKPCSPEMLNVEVATPVQNILGERSIEKIVNPVITHSPLLHNDESDIKTSNIIKNTSCNMTNHPFTSEPSNGNIKANHYSTQDLETNAGVCLASLPQLDNDLELNFPEINQQFINANKKVSNAITSPKMSMVVDTDQKTNVLHEKSTHQQINLLSPHTASNTEKEVSKLSKYRKNKKIEPSTPSPNDFAKTIISPITTQRIDSVIIKNPENIKLQDIQSNTSYGLNTLLEDHNDTFNNNNLSFEKAIDFSLNKIDVNVPIGNTVLNNINCTDTPIAEKHCDANTTCNNVSAEVILNKNEFTLGLEKNPEDKNDKPATHENVSENHENLCTSQQISNEENKHRTIISVDNDRQEDKFSRKIIQNISDENRDEPVTTSDSVSENFPIKQDIFSLNLQQETQDQTHIKQGGNIFSCQENNVESVKKKEDEFPNACEFTNSTGDNSFEEMLSEKSKDSPMEKHFSNLIGDNASKTEFPVLSVIHSRQTKDEVSILPNNVTISNNEVNKSVINESEIQTSNITKQKVSEATGGISNISLPILDPISEKDNVFFESITNSDIEKSEKITVSDAEESINTGDKDKLHQITEKVNMCAQQNEVTVASSISADTNLTQATNVLDKDLPDHPEFNINENNIDTKYISNSLSSTGSMETTDQDFYGENQHFHKNIANFNSIEGHTQANRTGANGSCETKSFDTGLLEDFESEKLLEPQQFNDVFNKNESIMENEGLPSFSPKIPTNNEINTNPDPVMHETTKTFNRDDVLNSVEENNTEYKSENDVSSSKSYFPQNEHVLNNNESDIDLNCEERSINNNTILNEIKNKNIDSEMSINDRIKLHCTQICTNYNVEANDNGAFYRKNVKKYKNLFSPWLQKLIMHTEGICVTNKEIRSEEGFNGDGNEFQTTPTSVENKGVTNLNEDLEHHLKEDISVNENYIQDNIIDTSDTTLVLILSSENPKDDLRPVNDIKNCVDTTPNEILSQKFEKTLENDIAVHTKINNRTQLFENKPKKILKRSLSESAIDNRTDVDANLLTSTKRRKVNDILQSNITAEDLCNIVQNNRRNSISTFYNEESVYILIDNELIITEENEESDKICFADSNVCIPHEESEPVFEKIDNTVENDDHLNGLHNNNENNAEESWYEDVACIETVFSDDVAEDITIDENKSPKIATEEDSENDDSHIFEEMRECEHINKIRNIYGDSVSNENVNLLETLYRTPQMDVNKTLVHIESHNLEACFLQEETSPTHGQNDDMNKLRNGHLCERNCFVDDKENLSNDSLVENKTLKTYGDVKESKVNVLFSDDKSLDEPFFNSCESSNDNFISNTHKDNSHYSYSSSPEVSSTTSEEKGILLKITNYNGSRSSQTNEMPVDMNKISYKLTENQEYRSYKSNFSSTRTLITKAAQKYIPPLKETVGDLKVKLPLPQHHLNKLKQLKISKIEPKINENIIRYKNRNLKVDIPKKAKPKFEDVLKSIDEIQFKKRKDKVKKGKSEIPKVVIKKGEDGAHYTSSKPINDEVYNPDLTGRKWQPWVFLEKNNFIDRMAIKKKHKAIYCHRKKTYVLAEKFRKYKSVYNAKFVITQPKSSTTHGNLKYTIRLQHK